MRRCLIISALLLAGCGSKPVAPPVIPADLLTPCPGWQGPRPSSEQQFARAALAEKAGRLCANEKLGSVREIVGW
jgi:hypothetical protein